MDTEYNADTDAPTQAEAIRALKAVMAIIERMTGLSLAEQESNILYPGLEQIDRLVSSVVGFDGYSDEEAKEAVAEFVVPCKYCNAWRAASLIAEPHGCDAEEAEHNDGKE